jgi:hypothetical protein
MMLSLSVNYGTLYFSLAFLAMLENPAAIQRWLTDPDTGKWGNWLMPSTVTSGVQKIAMLTIKKPVVGNFFCRQFKYHNSSQKTSKSERCAAPNWTSGCHFLERQIILGKNIGLRPTSSILAV